MSTLDHRRIDVGLRMWAGVTTGALRDEIVGSRQRIRQRVVDAKSVSTAKALSSAVTQVDEHAGTATVLVALRVTVSNAGAEPTEKYTRLQVTLLRTADGWKMDGTRATR